MHGLAEIREMNENPHRPRNDDAMFGGRHRDHGRYDSDLDEESAEPEHAGIEIDDIFAGLLIAGLAEKALHSLREQPKRHDALNSPLMKFWDKLNRQRLNAGRPEALYREAREIFNGGATPAGALTFVGEDDLRAVPIAGSEKAYHAEFRQVSADGCTIWRTVHNHYGPLTYTTPENALRQAKHAKLHAEDTENS